MQMQMPLQLQLNNFIVVGAFIYFCIFYWILFIYAFLPPFVVVDNNGIWVSSPRALRYRLCRINYTLCHLDSITNLCKSRFNLFNSHDPSMMAIQVRNKWVGI